MLGSTIYVGWIEADDDKGNIFLINSTDNGSTFGNKTEIPLLNASNPTILKLAISPNQQAPSKQSSELQPQPVGLFSHLQRPREAEAANFLTTFQYPKAQTSQHYDSTLIPASAVSGSPTLSGGNPSSAKYPPVTLILKARSERGSETTEIIGIELKPSPSGKIEKKETDISNTPTSGDTSIAVDKNFVGWVGATAESYNAMLADIHSGETNTVTKQSIMDGNFTDMPTYAIVAADGDFVYAGTATVNPTGEGSIFIKSCTAGGNSPQSSTAPAGLDNLICSSLTNISNVNASLTLSPAPSRVPEGEQSTPKPLELRAEAGSGLTIDSVKEGNNRADIGWVRQQSSQ